MALGGKTRYPGFRSMIARLLGLLVLLACAGGANAQSLVVQPGTLFFRNPSGSALTQKVAVSASSGNISSLSTSVAYPFVGTSFLNVTTSGSTVTVLVFPANLSAGVYTAAITVSSGGFAPATIRVVVTIIPVTSGFPANALILTPNTLNFQAAQNAPAATVPPVSLYNPGSENYDWSASANVNWVTITPSSGHGDTPLVISASGTGLTQGVKTGLISVTSSSTGTTITSQIAVSITVQAQQNATLAVSPTVVSLTAVTSGSPVQGLVNVYNAGGTTLNWTAQAVAANSGHWLSITPTSGSSTTASQLAGQIVVVANPSGLTAGLYSGTVTVTAGTSRSVVPVYLTVGAAVPTVSPLELFFTQNQNSTVAQSQTVTLSGTSGSLKAVLATTATAPLWFTVSSPSATTLSSSGITITASLVTSIVNTMAPGTYSGQIAIYTGGTTQQANVVRVVLHVAASTELPHLQVDRGGLAFSLAPGQGLSTIQTVNVSVPAGPSAGTAIIAIVTTNTGGNWLTVSPGAGTVTPSTPAPLSFSASAAGLPTGVYTGRVIVTAGTMTPVSIYATLVVGAPNGSSTNGVAPGALTVVLNNPSDGFITQQDFPNLVSATLLDSYGNPVLGATVTLQSSNGEPDLVLTDQGGGSYGASFHALFSGPLTLSASAIYSGVNGIQTAPAATAAGQMSPAQNTLPVMYHGGVVNSASYAVSPTPLSPGALVSVFGQGIAGTGGSAASGSALPTSLGGVSATMGGIPAPILVAVPSSSGDQVNLQVPFELNGQVSADVIFNVNGVLSPVETVPIGVVPAAFTTSQTGNGTAVLHTTDYTPVTSANPAVAGEILAIFANGLGPLTTPIADGALATVSDATVGVVTVSIGGQSAVVQYAGLAPGFAGLYQVNVVMPSVASGNNTLIIGVNGIASSGTATIPAQ
jgi:uncharacterized protein (TIGR03437 family)